MASSLSGDAFADHGGHELTDDHNDEDRNQHNADFAPGELVDGGLKHDADATSSNEAEYG
jgi:hypothetical protein